MRPGRPMRFSASSGPSPIPTSRTSAGSCGSSEADGTNREGAYWRYEVWLREQESALGSVTGGNGSIYAVRRSDYVEVDPRYGHDLALPYADGQPAAAGRCTSREAHAFEKPSRDLEDEYRRKVRMFEHCWLILLEGGMLRGQSPLYTAELVSHRVLRYGSGVAHVALLLSSIGLARAGGVSTGRRWQRSSPCSASPSPGGCGLRSRR